MKKLGPGMPGDGLGCVIFGPALAKTTEGISSVKDRPNILFITADHLRFDTLGCSGDPVIQTPAIDRLAGESSRFEQFFVQSPVCQPSRASIITGRYPRHHGVR
jgi:arylsulfatase A-like enzyme